MSACTGKCCSVFNFPSTPEQLRERGDAESLFLADMFVPLTVEEAVERGARFDVTPPADMSLVEWAENAVSYTCRHWDEETRLCGVYENRPKMCADYPYGRPCQHDCACTERGVGAEGRELESQRG